MRCEGIEETTYPYVYHMARVVIEARGQLDEEVSAMRPAREQADSLLLQLVH